MSAGSPDQITFLRHVVATIAYRGGKAIRGAPAGFGDVELSPGSRTALQILSHMGDVLAWARSTVEGDPAWSVSTAESWDAEVDRFFGLLRDLDASLGSASPDGIPALRLLQGPLADTLTHVGQLAMLRRLAGAPVRGENYFKAGIVAGRVGPDQAPSGHEFD